MDSDRFQRARRIFEEAAELSEAERASYLADACGDDDELRAEVDSLLDADSQTTLEPGIIDSGIPEDMLRTSLGGLASGTQIGEFEIIEILGAGGMGTVFKAVQANPRRVVAVKTMRFGLGAESARRRFEYESEVLGRLRHPGIAQVYAAGTFRDKDSGQDVPYFAMEYVEDARSLHVYVAQEQLGLHRTLQLFRQVCDAVSAGHQRGVIHRDLKPENILVDKLGQPKIIDFGIALGIDASAPELTRQTEVGQVLGTLNFMSPEQLGVGNAEADTRTDVYALGVILYELLAGRLPFDLSGVPLTRVAEIVCDAEPPAPSTSDTAISASGNVRELDWVTLKAIEKDPGRRYASVVELAADVDRFLAHEPVEAGPPSALYRVAKFARRHRAAVAAGLLITLSLVGGTTAALVGMVRAVNAEKETQQHLAAAREEIATRAEVSLFLRQMFASVHPAQDGSKVLVVDLLAEAAQRIDALYADRPRESVVLHTTIGDSFYTLGLTDRAQPLLEKAVAMGREVLGELDADTLQAMHVLGSCLAHRGENERAAALLRQTLEGYYELVGRRHAAPGATQVVLGLVLTHMGQLDEATKVLNEARDILLETVGRHDTRWIEATTRLSRVLENRERYRDALKLAHEAEEAAMASLGPTHPTTLNALQGQARILRLRGEADRALEIWERVLDGQQDALGEFHPVTLSTLNNLATALGSLGMLDEAEARIRQVLAVYERNGADHQNLFFVTNNLAILLQKQDKIEPALEVAEGLVARAERELPADHPALPSFRVTMAVCLRDAGRTDEAEAILIEAEKALRTRSGASNRMTLRACLELARLYEARGDRDAARPLRDRVDGR